MKYDKIYIMSKERTKERDGANKQKYYLGLYIRLQKSYQVFIVVKSE